MNLLHLRYISKNLLFLFLFKKSIIRKEALFQINLNKMLLSKVLILDINLKIIKEKKI